MPGDPNLIIGGYALAGLALWLFWQLITWVREAPVAPDPWDAETGRKVAEPETKEICPHCLAEQAPAAWFCPVCGRAVGPYNNMMPFVQIFSEGEVFRNGTSGRLRRSPLIIAGYILVALVMFSGSLVFFFLAPVYLVSVLLHWSNPAEEPAAAADSDVRQ